MSQNLYEVFYKNARFFYLVLTGAFYVLGSSIANYLGGQVDVGVFLLGLGLMYAVQLGVYFLDEVFSSQAKGDLFDPLNDGDPLPTPGRFQFSRRTIMGLLSAVFLTFSASLIVVLINLGRITPSILLFLVLGFGIAILYVSPPVRLKNSGYGELALSLMVTNLIPAFSFFLEFQEMHRFLAMVTFPLTLIHLAMLLALNFPTFAQDINNLRYSMLTHVGWERGMALHNYFLLGAFLILGIAAGLGLPSFVALPAFLPLPLGVMQVYYMVRISQGTKPNWTALAFSAVSSFGIMLYLMIFAFLTH